MSGDASAQDTILEILRRELGVAGSGLVTGAGCQVMAKGNW